MKTVKILNKAARLHIPDPFGPPIAPLQVGEIPLETWEHFMSHTANAYYVACGDLEVVDDTTPVTTESLAESRRKMEEYKNAQKFDKDAYALEQADAARRAEITCRAEAMSAEFRAKAAKR